MSVNNKTDSSKKLLGFPLTPEQDVLINYLVPSVGSCALYILLFATEVALIHRHFKDESHLRGWTTLGFMYLPALSSYVITLSLLELWPELKLCGKRNFFWFVLKTGQHLLFPVWSMWRFAERIFWSVEAYRSDDDESRRTALSKATSPRTIELYIFLQAFLHSLPQIIFQLHLLMRHSHTTDQETAHAQFLSIAFNMTKLAMTVTYYQRFKTQKLAGSQYPWYKAHKYQFDPSLDEVTLRRKNPESTMIPTSQNLRTDELSSGAIPKDEDDLYEPIRSRRSSDFYLEPHIRGTYLPAYSSRAPSVINVPSRMSRRGRLTSISQTVSNDSSEPDFNIRRVIYIKGMPEDDLAGKLIGFCWWSAFITARVLAISAFQYFYPAQVLYILVSHFILTFAILCYDAKTDEVTRSKAIFFIFVCYIYLFCIIEFKIKFKKSKFIYYGFFSIVYLENFVMCLVWWYGDLETIETDFWFRYVFYIILICSLSSFGAMLFYFSVNKPDKVIVRQILL